MQVFSGTIPGTFPKSFPHFWFGEYFFVLFYLIHEEKLPGSQAKEYPKNISEDPDHLRQVVDCLSISSDFNSTCLLKLFSLSSIAANSSVAAFTPISNAG